MTIKTDSWRSGVESCIRLVKNKQATLPDVRSPGFNAALDELLTHFEAMLVRNLQWAVFRDYVAEPPWELAEGQWCTILDGGDKGVIAQVVTQCWKGESGLPDGWTVRIPRGSNSTTEHTYLRSQLGPPTALKDRSRG